MNEAESRLLLCDTGRELVKKGLVTRTWGNLSIRISDEFFLISPSGRSYEDLAPEEIVEVSMADLSYQGSIKPSSEKNLHQMIFKQSPDIKGIIHTHQPYASSFAAAHSALQPSDNQPGLLSGRTVYCADYALPTTKKLAKTVAALIEKDDTPALFLANHGAVCWGTSLQQALEISEELEKLCRESLIESYRRIAGRNDGTHEQMLEYYVCCRRKGGK